MYVSVCVITLSIKPALIPDHGILFSMHKIQSECQKIYNVTKKSKCILEELSDKINTSLKYFSSFFS